MNTHTHTCACLQIQWYSHWVIHTFDNIDEGLDSMIDSIESYCWWFRNPKQPPVMYKNLVNNGINYLSLNWWAGFLPTTVVTPWKTNMSPENQVFEDAFPIEIVPFGGTFISFGGHSPIFSSKQIIQPLEVCCLDNAIPLHFTRSWTRWNNPLRWSLGKKKQRKWEHSWKVRTQDLFFRDFYSINIWFNSTVVWSNVAM